MLFCYFFSWRYKLQVRLGKLRLLRCSWAVFLCSLGLQQSTKQSNQEVLNKFIDFNFLLYFIYQYFCWFCELLQLALCSVCSQMIEMRMKLRFNHLVYWLYLQNYLKCDIFCPWMVYIKLNSYKKLAIKCCQYLTRSTLDQIACWIFLNDPVQ